MNVIPDMQSVLVGEDAAEHLLRLLARYDWCLADVRMYESRWRHFWPTLRWCERAMVRLFLFAQGARVGQRIRLEVDVARPQQSEAHRPVRISTGVEAEFVSVLGQHYRRLTSPAEIYAMWAARWPTATAAVALEATSATWFQSPEEYVPWRLFDRARFELMRQGWSAETAQHASATLAVALHEHLQTMEESICVP